MSERAAIVCDSSTDTFTVRVRGEIDHHTAADVRAAIDRELYARRPKRLTLDLSAVSFMDSSGLGLIMGRLAVMRELGGGMTVSDPAPETLTILKMAGMERLVGIEYTGIPPVSPRPESGKRTDTPQGGRTGSGRTRRRVKPSA